MWKFVPATMKVLGVALLTLHVSAHAQGAAATYPNKPIRFVVAFAPGGATDILARVVATQLSKDLGHQVIVENKAGASGVIAVETVLKAQPDGYTVLVGGSSPMVFNHIVFAKLPYKPQDITPVTILGSYPLVIAARKDLPAKTFSEVIALAKTRKPSLSYGHPGPAWQLQMDYLNQQLGLEMLSVQYKGAGPAALGMMSGDTDLLASDTATIVPMHKDGRAVAVAVTTKKRNPALPDVPTVAEVTGKKDFETSAFAALGVHHATSPEIVLKLQQAVAKALQAPEVKEQFTRLGIEAEGNSPAESAARINREIQLYTAIAETSGLKGTQ
ncbi:tripartite tricarboxylate transporter substrate binding protein [uncultured Pigmentiphaga sp.]|jgi:Uncharacterized protein conserved in bacteria|uniref:Bug family tripartite tricarboxylate transporter substrate binding protein n=1 Tax=uncultured Pigmentiphaga sp. TaxID=340361 RepID=UPI0026043F15|nr:tripartite tricarboxylate transporter substrate binding protein [uncultured Pigmentiphaga sp.]